MLQTHQLEELISVISALDKRALVQQIGAFDAGFPVDFTPEFLESQSLDRLRHLFVAMCLHTQRMPEISASAA